MQEGEERDVQDQLVELLQYDNFPLIKELMRNRTIVVWCQRLARAQNDTERSRIEVEAVFCCLGHMHMPDTDRHAAEWLLSEVHTGCMPAFGQGPERCRALLHGGTGPFLDHALHLAAMAACWRQAGCCVGFTVATSTPAQTPPRKLAQHSLAICMVLAYRVSLLSQYTS